VGEPGVVEADLGDAPLARDLERSANQRLVEPVGGFADTPHRVQRQLPAVVDEPHHGVQGTVG
jgi:hypothetical protein